MIQDKGVLETIWLVLLILRVTEKVSRRILCRINLWWKVIIETYLWLIVRVCLLLSNLLTKLVKLHNSYQNDRLLWANSHPDLAEETLTPLQPAQIFKTSRTDFLTIFKIQLSSFRKIPDNEEIIVQLRRRSVNSSFSLGRIANFEIIFNLFFRLKF